MARKKLTIPAKKYRVPKKTIHRKGYRKADGTYVKPSTYTRPAQTVKRKAYKREDVGAPGRGQKVIKVKKGGMVSPAGEYHISSPVTQRHKILKSLVTKAQKEGKSRDAAELSVYRRLLAMRTLFKRTHPSYSKIVNADMEYFKKNLTGANKKMAAPTAAIKKWKSMPHKERVKARARNGLKVGGHVSEEEIRKNKMTGYVRGEYFSGEWLDGSPMAGYGVYYVSDGKISNFGDFSESGKVRDAVDAGDLINIADERKFTVLTVE
jgi:hypothetical protein